MIADHRLPRTDRRSYLGAVGAAAAAVVTAGVGLGGCLGVGPGDDRAGTATRTLTTESGVRFAVATVATGLEVPRGAAHRGGDLHLTERPGRIVRVRDGRVVGRERLLDGAYGRLRTTFVDPDGHLCVTTSNRDGRGDPTAPDDRVLRLRPV